MVLFLHCCHWVIHCLLSRIREGKVSSCENLGLFVAWGWLLATLLLGFHLRGGGVVFRFWEVKGLRREPNFVLVFHFWSLLLFEDIHSFLKSLHKVLELLCYLELIRYSLALRLACIYCSLEPRDCLLYRCPKLGSAFVNEPPLTNQWEIWLSLKEASSLSLWLPVLQVKQSLFVLIDCLKLPCVLTLDLVPNLISSLPYLRDQVLRKLVELCLWCHSCSPKFLFLSFQMTISNFKVYCRCFYQLAF